MQKIKVLSDSGCDLSIDTAKKHNIGIFPLKVIYKGRQYLDKVEITSKQLYESLVNETPTTSLPDREYCHRVLDNVKEAGYTDVIVVGLSTKLSGTLNSIRIISQEYEEDINFHFFDTKTLGYPEGVIALEAAKMVQKNMNCEEILKELENIRPKVTGYVALNTLEFLVKGGRISKIKGTLGELVHLKPIISSNESGELYKFAQSRGRVQCINKLKKSLEEHLKRSQCSVWVLSGAADEEAQTFYDQIKDDTRIKEIHLETIGAAMAVHTGPKSLGLAILELNK